MLLFQIAHKINNNIYSYWNVSIIIFEFVTLMIVLYYRVISHHQQSTASHPSSENSSSSSGGVSLKYYSYSTVNKIPEVEQEFSTVLQQIQHHHRIRTQKTRQHQQQRQSNVEFRNPRLPFLSFLARRGGQKGCVLLLFKKNCHHNSKNQGH